MPEDSIIVHPGGSLEVEISEKFVDEGDTAPTGQPNNEGGNKKKKKYRNSYGMYLVRVDVNGKEALKLKATDKVEIVYKYKDKDKTA